jgi:HD-GYP domain-containing protein (c-di-GMP phosphodiesterase class II)
MGGTHFDPDVVQAFFANEARFVEIHERFALREERESRRLHPQAELSCN